MEPLKVWIVSLPERKEELWRFLFTCQVYSRKGLLCRSSHEVPTKMAIRFLEVRRRLHVAFFLMFTWNVEFLQTVAFKFVCHKWTSFLGQIFLVRKRWVHETASCTRITGSCKQSIKHKTQLQLMQKRRFESCLKRSQPQDFVDF